MTSWISTVTNLLTGKSRENYDKFMSYGPYSYVSCVYDIAIIIPYCKAKL